MNRTIPENHLRAITTPDLLHHDPVLRLDLEGVHEALNLSFLTGAISHTINKAIENNSVAASTWDAEQFAEHIFLDDFISECLTLEIRGTRFPVNQKFLRKVLTQPPTNQDTISFRKEILAEITRRKDLFAGVESSYIELFRLMTLFNTSRYGANLEISKYRIDILRQTLVIIDTLIEPFKSATSGMSRIHRFAVEIKSLPVYDKLQNLSNYMDRLAYVHLTVKIGADGNIAGIGVDEVKENCGNPIYAGPVARFFRRLKFWARGYRFSEEEVLGKMTDSVFNEMEPFLVKFIQLLAHLEVLLCLCSFRDLCLQRSMPICLAETYPAMEGGRSIKLENLYNPLLFSQDIIPVTSDIATSKQDPITIVTGPNSGGKTRLLQALGIAQLLSQNGFFVPASAAELPILSGMFASLIEKIDAHQSEGRLGSELIRIRNLFENSHLCSMIILDELCSGTNPNEGIEIFKLVLQLLHELKPVAYISTHFLRFAKQLQEAPPFPGMEFLQVALDENDEPLHRFIDGVATHSSAQKTAERLGVTYEQLSEEIRKKKG